MKNKNQYGPIRTSQKTGREQFTFKEESINRLLIDFWRWSVSDLVSNSTRGILAEYIVACDLGLGDDVRNEWSAYDLKTKDGLKIEIKTSAYCQSWSQKKHSNIMFGIAPTFGFDEESGSFTQEKVRHSDFYVFCVLKHKDQATIDPTKMEQWEFFILPTSVLNNKAPKQKTIRLSSLLRLAPKKVAFGEIGITIDKLKSFI